VTLTARTIADIASQFTTIKNVDMDNLLEATVSVIHPYKVNEIKVTVSGVSIDANGIATVTWSDTKNGTKNGIGSTVTVPPALNVPNTQLIWSEVTYNYEPIVGEAFFTGGSIDLFDQIYMRPRLSETINRVNS
jgi:Flp pilus assembly protein TadG